MNRAAGRLKIISHGNGGSVVVVVVVGGGGDEELASVHGSSRAHACFVDCSFCACKYIHVVVCTHERVCMHVRERVSVVCLGMHLHGMCIVQLPAFRRHSPPEQGGLWVLDHSLPRRSRNRSSSSILLGVFIVAWASRSRVMISSCLILLLSPDVRTRTLGCLHPFFGKI